MPKIQGLKRLYECEPPDGRGPYMWVADKREIPREGQAGYTGLNFSPPYFIAGEDTFNQAGEHNHFEQSFETYDEAVSYCDRKVDKY